jgi:hypothetical protein
VNGEKYMVIENFVLNSDVKVLCVTAKSFPNGIVEAFQTLENLDPSICERPFYGISFQNREGKIIYKAAVAEEFEGEGSRYGCETFVIGRGEYQTITIYDFMENIDVIPKAFQKLLEDPRLDLNFPCVEWYKSSKEVMCMVRINQSKK